MIVWDSFLWRFFVLIFFLDLRHGTYGHFLTNQNSVTHSSMNHSPFVLMSAREFDISSVMAESVLEIISSKENNIINHIATDKIEQQIQVWKMGDTIHIENQQKPFKFSNLCSKPYAAEDITGQQTTIVIISLLYNIGQGHAARKKNLPIDMDRSNNNSSLCHVQLLCRHYTCGSDARNERGCISFCHSFICFCFVAHVNASYALTWYTLYWMQFECMCVRIRVNAKPNEYMYLYILCMLFSSFA